jgi:hypothetical protein
MVAAYQASQSAAATRSSSSSNSPTEATNHGSAELPIHLQLVKPMTKGPLGSIYLAKDRATDAFFLLHVVKKSSVADDENMDVVRANLLFSRTSLNNSTPVQPSIPSGPSTCPPSACRIRCFTC